jgi:hypothetical protein
MQGSSGFVMQDSAARKFDAASSTSSTLLLGHHFRDDAMATIRLKCRRRRSPCYYSALASAGRGVSVEMQAKK